jgi:hypothetical protein
VPLPFHAAVPRTAMPANDKIGWHSNDSKQRLGVIAVAMALALEAAR